MALGMGGRATPIAQLLSALGWGIIDVPFFVAPVRLARVLTNLPQLRQRPLLKRFVGLAARTGSVAALGFPLTLFRKFSTGALLRRSQVEVTPAFGGWADEVWARTRGHYGLVARRDAEMLNDFYPPDFQELTRLRVKRNGQDIGWIAVTLMRAGSRPASRDFGDLRVGWIADGLCHPADAATLVAAACDFLSDAGVDILVSNQTHPSWQRALRYLGFVRRPTNFLFAYSKKMGDLLASELASRDLLLNRGDCDGPPR
jgi:hypothetical protein